MIDVVDLQLALHFVEITDLGGALVQLGVELAALLKVRIAVLIQFICGAGRCHPGF